MDMRLAWWHKCCVVHISWNMCMCTCSYHMFLSWNMCMKRCIPRAHTRTLPPVFFLSHAHFKQTCEFELVLKYARPLWHTQTQIETRAHAVFFFYLTGACEAPDAYLMMIWLTMAEGCFCVCIRDEAAVKMEKGQELCKEPEGGEWQDADSEALAPLGAHSESLTSHRWLLDWNIVLPLVHSRAGGEVFITLNICFFKFLSKCILCSAE